MARWGRAGAGGAVLGAVVHYVILISLLGIGIVIAAYAIGIMVARVRPRLFAKAMIGPQAVAISTQSSLASLPAMLAAARLIGIRETVIDIALPLSVALFRATGPAMNIGVVFYIAHWFGLEPTAMQIPSRYQRFRNSASDVRTGRRHSIGDDSEAPRCL